MAYRTKLLVVANQTVDSDELLDDLRDRAGARSRSRSPSSCPQDAFAGMAHRINARARPPAAGGIEA